ncbi:chromosome segregation protein SMC [Tepidimonas taiwanensis]|uniref:Chromosome partition protein Smc n=1 Tax=Tepidimonas taiwanensis TaxID=307486 RepID=A0A554X3H0_9BURK|nr:chromosome segregation protein SMC [Tepidimonas taiwanensis]MCX7692954.1 chromosome segregation protein SMC [Tepidimonas taiwanensis]TSE30389.1 Chromosome partition protein Smc [Tepidimonas taiwanensis]UBQ06552.1 chromosome segregation protein SMC [Tepidimonas taiwanensis]
MRLQTIKLSGFKSFAEPTVLHLPGQRVGVVGPNGCGKSNIMDAVRWVLGESKASELRGESMQDVIFNGTTTRKPAQRASVELVFDNSARRAGGPWNQYAEISVKRVLTRDGTSSYYINQQPVRRRDVQDVFLGTGLGPRAYAIIGQGTISRIIESRPEELRLFLEEAAGVSKYKERRRETANRLADTRENLTRVEDILRELNGQLERLEQQAAVARRYHELQSIATRRQHQLWWLKREEARAQLEQVRSDGTQAVNALQERMAELRRAEADLEAIRQAHYDAGEEVNRAQGQWYAVGAEVARLEAEIRFAVEGRQRAEQRLAALVQQLADWETQAATAQQEQAALDEQAVALAEHAEILAARVAEETERLPSLEDGWRQAQARVQQQRQQVAEVQRAIGVLAAEQRALDEQARQLQQRRERLRAERHTVAAPDESRLQHWRAERDAAREALAAAEARLAEGEATLPAAEAERREAQQAERAEAQRLGETQARLQALRALQEKVQTDERLRPWLQRHGLEGLAALWTRLDTEPGWEAALEAALRERLQALPAGRLDALRALERDAPPAKLAFYAPPAGGVPSAMAAPEGLVPLVQRLRVHDAPLHALLSDWLHGCLGADDLDTALRLRERLGPGQRCYTPAGHSVGAHDIAFYAADDAQAGLLARAHEIEQLERAVRAQGLLVEEAHARAQRADAQCHAIGQQLQQARRDVADARQRLHAAEVEVLKGEQAAEHSRRHQARLDQDLAEVDAALEDVEARRVEAEARFEALDLQLADTQEQLAHLEDAAAAAERELAQAREQARAAEREAQEAAFAQRAVAQRHAEWQRQAQTAHEQMARLRDERARLEQELAQHTDPVAREALQVALAERQRCEEALAAARSRYDELTARLRAADEQRLRIERELEPLRTRITEFQLKEQAAQLALDQYGQWLADAGADPDEVGRTVEADGVRLQGLQGEIDRLQREITALGAVNLAALEELTAARERQQFLHSQSQDLQQAIQTLEDAIRKIDAETRALLAQTFETVNGHFGRMFPELFGGGQARLIMTGEEILDAGVQVMAQPPGKKNQTIHLLSGGEKALTAIALVFAIFQLNPAPFCLLDEVDAPLDDANTERYAQLVTRMSRDTQFLFISHNRIAMAMAEQLIGVTMQEQGVSRVVAVDLAAATSMMENAAP